MSKHVFTRYISGPMRGVPDYNYPVFNEVEDYLRKLFPDHVVLNPASNFGGATDLPVTTYMAQDFQQVIAADEIVLLPGWEKSEGSRREVELAKWLSKDFAIAYKPAPSLDEWMFELLPEPPSVDGNSPRGDVLDEARALITGDRNNSYGPPTQDFDRTAAMATAWGFSAQGGPLKGHHVAVFMVLLKMSRLAWTPGKRDSWVDTAGYAGCGYECAVNEAA